MYVTRFYWNAGSATYIVCGRASSVDGSSVTCKRPRSVSDEDLEDDDLLETSQKSVGEVPARSSSFLKKKEKKAKKH